MFYRIANNTKRDSDDSGGDDENDNDWSYGESKKGEISLSISLHSPLMSHVRGY